MEKETLTKLMNEVKEEGLSKDKLEQLHTHITYLDSVMRMEIALIEKEEAIFFQLEKTKNSATPDIVIKRLWRSGETGLRQIELSHYLKVTPKLLQSCRTRLYAIY